MNAGKLDFNGTGADSPGTARLVAKWGVSALMLALAACATAPDDAYYEPSASMGLLIARDSCAGCHETGRTGESSNADATPFHEIVERPGMTPERLAAWLRDGHNYPAEMGMRLEPHQIDSLVAYMIRQQAGEPVAAP